MTTATNPQTGERFELIGGRWVPIQGRSDAAQPTPRERPAAPELGAIEGVLVGAGDVFNTVGLNARDIWARVRGDTEGQAQIAGERAEADAVRAQIHEAAPIASTIGGMLPGLAAAPLGGAGVLGQLATGAAISGATSQSGELVRDAGLGAILGGVGMGGQSVVQRVMNGRATRRAALSRGAVNELTQGEQEIIEGARRAGMAVLPGQASGNKFMRQMEASMASHPITGGVFGEIEQANKQQLNRLAARAMGVEGADSVSAEVRAMAEHRLSQSFESIGQAIGPVNTAPLRKTLAELASDEGTSLLPRTELDSILARFERGAANRHVAVGGEGADQVSGVALMRERSRIARQMRDAYARNDSSAGELYGNVLDAMDDAVAKAAVRTAKGDPDAGAALLGQYSQAREQWNVLRAMDRGGASIDGNVLPGQAARLINSGDKTGFIGRANDAGMTTQKRGTGILGQNPTGDLYDALRFAHSQIGRPVVGDSGTATRMSLQTSMEGGLAATAARAALRFGQSRAATAYANMSPEAAATAAAVVQGMRNPGGQAPGMVDILRTGAAGGLGGAFGGGL